MKKTIIITAIIAMALTTTGHMSRLTADLFYSQTDYNKLYNEKVAVELELGNLHKKKVSLENELKSLKEQYENDRFNLEKTINELKNQISDLKNRIQNLNKERDEDKRRHDNRVMELTGTIDLLKKTSSDREKDLIKKNREIQERHELELDKLNKLLSSEREKNINDIKNLKEDCDKKISELQDKIKNLNLELDSLKRLTESQKKELDRLAQQTNYLEKLLESEIKEGKIRLKKFHDKIIINIDDKISFDSGSARLKKEILPALGKISKILFDYSENNIVIEGHTDNVPIISNIGFRDNWHLSTERALAVLNFLLKTTKLNEARFSAAGYAEYHPIVPNNSPANRALNRRVDIVILPRVK